jgi:hypothetical protein
MNIKTFVYNLHRWDTFIEKYMKPTKIFEKIINELDYKKVSLIQYKRLCNIIDNNNINMCRIYLNFAHQMPNIPKNLSVLTYLEPLIIQNDIDFTKNRLLSTKKDFIKKIEKERT